MTNSEQPTEPEIRAAVRILYEEACFYRWWPITVSSFEEFCAKDPVAVAELTGIVERMLAAAQDAKKANAG